MWKQLTQRARKAIFLAQEEAGRLGYSHVAPEHLLLAIVREDDCMAIKTLESIGLDSGTVRVNILKNVEKGEENLGQEMQLTPEAKDSIDRAFSESKSMNEEWVGTEHLLIGIADSKNIASEQLMKLGADSSTIRTKLRSLHAGTLPFEKSNGSKAIA